MGLLIFNKSNIKLHFTFWKPSKIVEHNYSSNKGLPEPSWQGNKSICKQSYLSNEELVVPLGYINCRIKNDESISSNLKLLNCIIKDWILIFLNQIDTNELRANAWY